jgi:hypothetical protein
MTRGSDRRGRRPLRAMASALKAGLSVLIPSLFWTGFILVMISQAPEIDTGQTAPSLEYLSQIHHG